MSTALSIDPAPAILIRQRVKAKSTAHRISLGIVWLTVALSFLVFTEPAPIDALTIGLFVLLPVVGLFYRHDIARQANFSIVYTRHRRITALLLALGWALMNWLMVFDWFLKVDRL